MNKNLIYVFHSDEQKDKDGIPQQRLICEGSSRNTVWTPCDFGGYMQMLGNKRYISFTPEQEFFSKAAMASKGDMRYRALAPPIKTIFSPDSLHRHVPISPRTMKLLLLFGSNTMP